MMGCLYACTCGGLCISCRSYKPEQYFGHAEDLLAQMHGYRDSDEWERALSNHNEEEVHDDQTGI